MNLDELKPAWHRYASSIAAAEERTMGELDTLLPPDQPAYRLAFTNLLIKNAAVCAFLIVCCGGC